MFYQEPSKHNVSGLTQVAGQKWGGGGGSDVTERQPQKSHNALFFPLDF